MKVLFLTRYPYEGASSRYRVFQYIPYLEKRGIACTTSSFMSPRMYALSFQKGRHIRKAIYVILASLKRLKILYHYKAYDIIVMQRELFLFSPAIFEKYLARKDVKLIFDYDDALFIHKQSRFNPLGNFLKPKNKIYDIFKAVDCAIAGNDFLREAAQPHCPYAITLEVAEDTDRIKHRPPHHNSKPLIIGWLGSTSTVKYIGLIQSAMRRIKHDFPDVIFEIVGGGDFHLEGLCFKHTAWSLDEELNALTRFDIGIMPLPQDSWSKGKSGGKARTYMAAGVPVIAQNIGYNKHLIKHGETGLLAETEEEWYHAMKTLLKNPKLRQSMGEAARRDIIRRFSPKDKADELVDIFNHVISQPKRIHHE